MNNVKYKPEYLRQKLHEGIHTVTFTKVNGDLRIMDCTTNLDKIPPSQWPNESKQVKEHNQNNIRVYDVKAQGWRSFIVDNVKEFA